MSFTSNWQYPRFRPGFVDARALFERVIGEFTAETARPLWERWARYEYHFGDLAAAQKLEKRITEVYPNGQLPGYPDHKR